MESSVGLKKIEIAAVPEAGLPVVWTELKAVKIGSAKLTEAAPSTTDVKIEQKPTSTYRKITTEAGETTLTVELYDVTPDNLVLLKGGSVTGDGDATPKVWKKGVSSAEIQKAVRLTTNDDFVIILPQAHVEAVINWALTVGDLATLSVTFTPLQPTDVTLPSIQIEQPL